ncbi:MAG: DNA repair exonuclease [Bacillota bacterium]
MIRCLHLADLHLGWSPQDNDFPKDKCRLRQEERNSVLTQAVDFAKDPQNGIDLVIIAGDLFETHTPEPALIEHVLSKLRQLDNAGIPVITVPGNHDEITYHNSVYRQYGTGRTWPGVLVQTPMPELVFRHEIKGVPVFIYSLAYTGGLTKVNELNEFPRLDEPGLHIGVFHGSLDWSGAGDRSLPLSSERLVQAGEGRGYDYLALGHIHKYQEMRAGKTVSVYPGLIDSKGFSDPGVGYMTIAQFECEGDPGGNSGFRVNLRRANVPVREHAVVEIDISAKPDLQEIASECRSKAGPDAMVKVILSGVPSFSVDLERLRAALGEHFFWVEVEDESSFLESSDIARFEKEPTIRGCFTRRMLEKLKNSTSDQEREVIMIALRKGLAAFEGR